MNTFLNRLIAQIVLQKADLKIKEKSFTTNNLPLNEHVLLF